MWRNSSLSDIYSSLPPPEKSGWRFSDGTYTESDEVQQKTQRSIDFLLKGAVVKRGARLTFVDTERRTAFVVQDACAKVAQMYVLTIPIILAITVILKVMTVVVVATMTSTWAQMMIPCKQK